MNRAGWGWALAMLAGVVAAQGETLGPGVFYGAFDETRWGQQVFQTGPHVLLVADEVAKRFAGVRGRPAEVEVTKMNQPSNPGGARIEEVAGAKEKSKWPGLEVSASLDQARAARGQGTVVRFEVKNISMETLRMSSGGLNIILVTNSMSDGKGSYLKGEDGFSYWMYINGFVDQESGRDQMVYCHEVFLPRQEADKRPAWIEGDREDFYEDFHRKIRLAPGESFRGHFEVGKELPPGEYEILVHMMSGNFSNVSGASSKRLAFDVTP